MANKALLQAALYRNGENLGAVAKVLNISRTAASLKINGKTQFSQRDISKLREHLRLSDTEVVLIFFNGKCASDATESCNA